MRRDDLIRLVAAASRLTGGGDMVVVGAAALLAVVEDPSGALAAGGEADMYALEHPQLGSAIDDALGVDSMYHQEHGICARGSGPMTPMAPAGWRDRLVPLDAGRVRAWCMEPHDLVIAKLVVGRGKDVDFCLAALAGGLVRRELLDARLQDMPLDEHDRGALRLLLERITG